MKLFTRNVQSFGSALEEKIGRSLRLSLLSLSKRLAIATASFAKTSWIIILSVFLLMFTLCYSLLVFNALKHPTSHVVPNLTPISRVKQIPNSISGTPISISDVKRISVFEHYLDTISELERSKFLMHHPGILDTVLQLKRFYQLQHDTLQILNLKSEK